MAILGEGAKALGAVDITSELIMAALDGSAVVHELGAVGVGVFHRIVVEVLVHVRLALPVLGEVLTPSGLCHDRPGPFIERTHHVERIAAGVFRIAHGSGLHPAAFVDVVNVVIVEATATGPDEAVEAADLPADFLKVLVLIPEFLRDGPRGRHRTVHTVAAHEHHIAHGAFLNFVGHCAARAAVPAHEAHAHLEVLLLGHLVDLKDLLGAIAIGGHGFFHEHIHTPLHSVFVEHPAEGRRRGEDGHIALVEIADGFLVGLKANVGALGQTVFAGLAEIHLLLMLFGKAVEAALEFVLKNIRGSHKFGGAVSG